MPKETPKQKHVRMLKAQQKANKSKQSAQARKKK